MRRTPRAGERLRDVAASDLHEGGKRVKRDGVQAAGLHPVGRASGAIRASVSVFPPVASDWRSLQL